ncbi:MAG: DEAD/DEAH box helicase [Longimicrobiales bacterium]
MTDPETDRETEPPVYYYRHGLAVLRHVREAPPWMQYDDRADAYVAPGHRLPELREWAEARGIKAAAGAAPGAGRPGSAGTAAADGMVAGDPSSPEPLPFYDPRSPRPYQEDAVARWEAAEGRGSVVLPTGSGKTFVAILAIQRTLGGGEGRACVVAPTRALVAQWYAQLADAFGADRVGAYYADEKDVRQLTVTTYHSAFDLLEREGAAVRLLVLDEAHHLEDTAAGGPKAWHDALRIAPAPYRLGLTATYPDGRDAELRRLVGGVVYRRAVGEMADAELADFALERRFVALTPGERERYEAAEAEYEDYIARKGFRDRYPDPGDAWRVFMAETRRRPAARRAFRAFLERERVVILAENKLREVYRILALHPAERAVLFTGNVAAAESLSERLAVPMITADTPASERKRLLEDMSEGRVRAVASVRVLDEGWDVPAAKLGVILGDSSRGGRRQHAQRLGRILRRQGDRVASLYEVVAADTYEFFASQKRRGGLARGAEPQLGLGL